MTKATDVRVTYKDIRIDIKTIGGKQRAFFRVGVTNYYSPPFNTSLAALTWAKGAIDGAGVTT